MHKNKCTDGGIRTADLWCPKQPLCQPRLNLCLDHSQSKAVVFRNNRNRQEYSTCTSVCVSFTLPRKGSACGGHVTAQRTNWITKIWRSANLKKKNMNYNDPRSVKIFEFEASRKFWSFYVFAEWRTQIHLRIRYEWWESSSTIISFSSLSLIFSLYLFIRPQSFRPLSRGIFFLATISLFIYFVRSRSISITIGICPRFPNV